MCRKHDWQYSILQNSILIRFKIHEFIDLLLLCVQSTFWNSPFDGPSYVIFCFCMNKDHVFAVHLI